MDIQANYDEVRSIIEACHCKACDDFGCDFDDLVTEAMDRLLDYDKREEI